MSVQSDNPSRCCGAVRKHGPRRRRGCGRGCRHNLGRSSHHDTNEGILVEPEFVTDISCLQNTLDKFNSVPDFSTKKPRGRKSHQIYRNLVSHSSPSSTSYKEEANCRVGLIPNADTQPGTSEVQLPSLTRNTKVNTGSFEGSVSPSRKRRRPPSPTLDELVSRYSPQLPNKSTKDGIVETLPLQLNRCVQSPRASVHYADSFPSKRICHGLMEDVSVGQLPRLGRRAQRIRGPCRGRGHALSAMTHPLVDKKPPIGGNRRGRGARGNQGGRRGRGRNVSSTRGTGRGRGRPAKLRVENYCRVESPVIVDQKNMDTGNINSSPKETSVNTQDMDLIPVKASHLLASPRKRVLLKIGADMKSSLQESLPSESCVSPQPQVLSNSDIHDEDIQTAGLKHTAVTPTRHCIHSLRRRGRGSRKSNLVVDVNIINSDTADSELTSMDDSDEDLPEVFTPSSQCYLEEGTLVWVKHFGYPYWPSLIQKVFKRGKNKRISFYFIGLNEIRSMNLQSAGRQKWPLFGGEYKIHEKLKNQGLASCKAELFGDALSKAEHYLMRRAVDSNAPSGLDYFQNDDNLELMDSPLEDSDSPDIQEEESAGKLPVPVVDDEINPCDAAESSFCDNTSISKKLRKRHATLKKRFQKIVECVKINAKMHIKQVLDGQVKSHLMELYKIPIRTKQQQAELNKFNYGPTGIDDDDEQIQELVSAVSTYYKELRPNQPPETFLICHVLIPEAIISALMRLRHITRKQAENRLLYGEKHTKEELRHMAAEVLNNANTISPEDQQRYEQRRQQLAQDIFGGN